MKNFLEGTTSISAKYGVGTVSVMTLTGKTLDFTVSFGIDVYYLK